MEVLKLCTHNMHVAKIIYLRKKVESAEKSK